MKYNQFILCLCIFMREMHFHNGESAFAKLRKQHISKTADGGQFENSSFDGPIGFMSSICNSSRINSREFTDTPPWIPAGYVYRPGTSGLHTEIEHFNAYMMPTPVERALRIQVLKRIESVVMEIWPEVRVEVFGSVATGMSLPFSDIDLTLLGVRGEFPLRALAAKLLDRGIVESNSIVLLEKATVPIIKMIDRESKLMVDIAFTNNHDVTPKAHLISNFKRKYPPLPKLVLVLKQFLVLHDLNFSYTGGISSFALVLMCINFLQMQPTQKVGEQANLGILLLEFLEMYGQTFDYDQSCIRIVNGGQYLPKKGALHVMGRRERTSFLCIQDPLQSWENIARRSFRAHQVKCAFEYAFISLSNALNQNSNNSKLGAIIQATAKLVDHRNWVQATFNTVS